MSRSWQDWAIKQRCGSPLQKLVLMILADEHRLDNDRCDPSHGYIADLAEASKEGVIKAIKKLESDGLVQVVRGAGRNKYRLQTPEEIDRSMVDSVHHEIDIDGGLSSPPQCTQSTTMVDSVHQNGALSSPTPGRDTGITGRVRAREDDEIYPPRNFKPSAETRHEIDTVAEVDHSALVVIYRNTPFRKRHEWQRRYKTFALENAGRKHTAARSPQAAAAVVNREPIENTDDYKRHSDALTRVVCAMLEGKPGPVVTGLRVDVGALAEQAIARLGDGADLEGYALTKHRGDVCACAEQMLLRAYSPREVASG